MLKAIYFVCFFGLSLTAMAQNTSHKSLINLVQLPGLSIGEHLYSPQDIVISMQFSLPQRMDEQPSSDGKSYKDWKIEIDQYRKDREQKKLAFVIYKDGTAVWSDNFIQGGPPFHFGKVDMNQVDELLNQFDKKEFFNKYKFKYDYEMIRERSHKYNRYDSSIFVRNNEKFFFMNNFWELLEQNPTFVATANNNSYELLPNETRAEILDKQPPEYLKERNDWTDIKQSILKLFQKPMEVSENAEIQVQNMYLLRTKDFKFLSKKHYPNKPLWEKTQQEFDKENLELLKGSMESMPPAQKALIIKALENKKQEQLKNVPQEQREAYEKQFDQALEKVMKGEPVVQWKEDTATSVSTE